MAFFRAQDGTRLHYTDEGNGTPILCLSGLTRNSEDFSYVTPHLPACRLIKLDYRGRGLSEWREDYMTYSVPVEMGDAIALLDHLGIAQAGILGTSRGGLIAMAMAVAAPDRLRGAALVDVGPELDLAGLGAIMGYLGQPPQWTTHAEAAAARASLMTGFDDVPPGRWMDEVRKLYKETAEGLVLTYDPRLRDAVIAAAEAMPEPPDMWPMFDALATKPLACIRGANSDLLSRDTLDRMQTRAPDMIVAEVPGRAHVPFLDEPQSIAALKDWIGKLA